MKRNQSWEKDGKGKMVLIEDESIPDDDIELSLEDRVKTLEDRINFLENLI